ncbi:anthocyanidin 3-O-glucosyltransferase-like, partial [Chenopodium quinoa]|uniref:anthocyanidin 3-O-glucosyltransferase-like n=1 Tax=Chenopodium quinoa TaxID=63459 RepID=UPI000B7721C2
TIPGYVARIESSLNNKPLNQVIPLTIPPTEGLSSNFDNSSDITPETGELLQVPHDKMQPQVRTLLSHLQPHIILFDFAHYWIPSIAYELGIKDVNYSVFSAVANLYLTIPAKINDPNKQPTVNDLKVPPPGFPKTSITSIKTFQARDFLYLFKSFNGLPSGFNKIMSFIKSCDAIIYKTCTEIEGLYIDYLKTQIGKPILLAGSAVPPPPSGKLEEKWETWLGKFPEQSVIFCNFGSKTYLDNEQIQELTLGLELTGLPFFLMLMKGSKQTKKRKKVTKDTDEYTLDEEGELNHSSEEDKNEIRKNAVNLRSRSKKVVALRGKITTNTKDTTCVSSVSIANQIKMHLQDTKRQQLDQGLQGRDSTQRKIQLGKSTTQKKSAVHNQQGKEVEIGNGVQTKTWQSKTVVALGSLSAYRQMQTQLREKERRAKQSDLLL